MTDLDDNRYARGAVIDRTQEGYLRGYLKIDGERPDGGPHYEWSERALDIFDMHDVLRGVFPEAEFAELQPRLVKIVTEWGEREGMPTSADETLQLMERIVAEFSAWQDAYDLAWLTYDLTVSPFEVVTR